MVAQQQFEAQSAEYWNGYPDSQHDIILIRQGDKDEQRAGRIRTA